MSKIQINIAAPDFELPDFNGNTFRLSQLRGQQHVILVFNRGFV